MDDMTKTMSNMFSGSKDMKKEPMADEAKPEEKRAAMSMHEITHSLHERLEEEVQDALDYLNMACSAKEMCHHALAEDLLRVAFEENSHACLIYQVMDHYGVHVDEETKTEYEAMRSRFRSIHFCD